MNKDYFAQSLVTVPNSVQEQIERAESLLDRSFRSEANGDNSVAVIRAREGLRVLQTLAQSSPEHAALIFAGQLGHRGIEIETVHTVERFEIVEEKFLGFTIGTKVVRVPTITTRTHRMRFL